MLQPFCRFGGRRRAFEHSNQLAPLEAQAASKAIECENIFGRYSHIYWLSWTEVPYSHAKIAPDIQASPDVALRVKQTVDQLAAKGLRALAVARPEDGGHY